ncbi:MAG: hypothetical protein ACOY93_01860 [Bacillota bacterium]
MNKILGIMVVILGMILLTRLFVSGTVLFLIVAAVLALAAGTGQMGRTGYVLAGIFLVLALASSAFRFALGAFGMLFRLAPILLVLGGIYMIAKAIRR